MRDTSLRFHTTNAILWEFFTLARARLGYERAIAATDAVRRGNSFTVHYLDRERDAAVWALLGELRAFPLSYADASLVFLGRELGIREVFGFDRDFALAGMDLVPRLPRR